MCDDPGSSGREASDTRAESVLIGQGCTPRPGDYHRLEQVFEDRCAQLLGDGRGDQLAVHRDGLKVGYLELDAGANQWARVLRDGGVRPGDRVGLLFEDALDTYLGMLAVLKVSAVFVPLDVEFPAERVAFIGRDAELAVVLTRRKLRDNLGAGTVPVWFADDAADDIAARSSAPLSRQERGEPADDLAYVIYTSGSTGTPKGVAVEHASIVNFVQVAAENYGLIPDDRVYQGLTVAFDFSVEEIWVPWVVGATLVPKPGARSLVADELAQFIREHDITALCCVPTLLASIDDELPQLRFVLVSGEACPQDLVRRWSRPGRRLLNVYGPTEATVTATWAELRPGHPVTLGVPLPTYSVAVLDPERPQVVSIGDVGEIAIAGVGLARGYLNRPERTEQSFIPDFLGLPDNPTGRLYRTGDLGRVNADGEIEYHGRIDTQVKVRGYRIELTEIESVLLSMPGIAQAVVDTHDPGTGIPELVAYYSLRGDTGGFPSGSIRDFLRDRLPAFMMPAYLQHLATIPLLPSNKADRAKLPAPSTRAVRREAHRLRSPRTALERRLAHTLAQVLGLPADELSTDSDFFEELGANSLLLARFRAELACGGAPPIAVRDLYTYRTVADLAAALERRAVGGGDTAASAGSPGHHSEVGLAEATHAAGVATVPGSPVPPGRLAYALCGVAQIALLGAYFYLLTLSFTPAFDWVDEATGLAEGYARSVLVGAAFYVTLCVAPIALKWLLIGRFTSEAIPLWRARYVRFWLVKTLLRVNPIIAFIGTPLYTLYLRALGARIGSGTLILTRYPPICTDLISIGACSVIRKDVFLNGYRAQNGALITGPVAVGERVVVGEGSVLDIDSQIGDRGQLGHSSVVHSGQVLPPDTRWHGSPVEPTTVDYLNIDPEGTAGSGASAEDTARPSRARMVTHCIGQLVPVVGIYAPILVGGLASTLSVGPWLLGQENPGQGRFYLTGVEVGTAVFLLVLLFGPLLVVLLARALGPLVKPGRLYPLYGWHYGLHRLIFRLSNAKMFMRLFGDSSYIVGYLSALGWRLRPVEQTGSNFGVIQQTESASLASVGLGTMISDGLSVMNAWHSATSFRVEHAAIGARNFLGNLVRYPSGARVGTNCLLATKVHVPLDGPEYHDTGLLGSPAFPIPRSVLRDHDVAHPPAGAARARAVAAKTSHNLVTLALFLAALWVYVVGAVLLILLVDVNTAAPAVIDSGAELGGLVVTAGYFAVLERAALGFRRLRPRTCSIYDPTFWRHERFWKFATPAMPILDGTPLKPMLLRLQGARVGRRIFDDGASIPERSLVTLGDDCALNMGSALQAHSLEDGVFKSDHITVGAGSTVSVAAFVHYATTIGERCAIDADSLLMKGELVGDHQRWRGNPAQVQHPTLSVVRGDARPGESGRPARSASSTSTMSGRIAAS